MSKIKIFDSEVKLNFNFNPDENDSDRLLLFYNSLHRFYFMFAHVLFIWLTSMLELVICLAFGITTDRWPSGGVKGIWFKFSMNLIWLTKQINYDYRALFSFQFRIGWNTKLILCGQSLFLCILFWVYWK